MQVDKNNYSLSSILRLQCSSNWDQVKFFGLDEPENILNTLISNIIKFRHSESALLIGDSGTGKKSCFYNIMNNKLKNDKNKEIIIIELDGLLHNDPRIACQEIIFQLTNSICNLGTFDEAGDIVFNYFKDMNKIFFIYLHGLDLFASLQRGKQSLLYYLFDMLHHPDICLCIIGSTIRIDCISLFEKRVISRFSQIQIFFYPPAELIDYLLFIQHRLLISNKNIKKYNLSKDLIEQYNQKVQSILKEDVSIISLLERCYELSKNPKKTLEFLKLVIMNINNEPPFYTSKIFFNAFDKFWIDPHKYLIEGLSILELCLVISFMTFEVNQDNPQYNFERSYENYKLFATATNAPGSLYSKPVALKAFETLLELEIIIPIKKKLDTKIPLEYREIRLTLDPYQVQEIIKRSDTIVTHLKNWATYLVIHVKN